jgi:hypothetical protein
VRGAGDWIVVFGINKQSDVIAVDIFYDLLARWIKLRPPNSSNMFKALNIRSKRVNKDNEQGRMKECTVDDCTA